MQGIGRVYQQFADGDLEDDDEVTMRHAPQELAYQPLSEAMVNIRATLAAAAEAAVINAVELLTLIQTAKNTWYPQRSYARLLHDAASLLNKETLQALSSFIADHAVNVKRDDAIALVKHLSDICGRDDLAAKTVDYAFEHTDAWEMLIEQVKREHFQAQNSVDLAAVYRELKIQGRYAAIKQQAQARQIALQRGQDKYQTANAGQVRSALILFSQEQGFIENGEVNFSQLAQWFGSQRLDMPRFDQLIRKQAMLNWLDTVHDNVDEELLDILRLNNQLAHYLQRIADKKALTINDASHLPTLSGTGLSSDELWRWYFQSCLQQAPPADLAAFALKSGFRDVDEMRQAVLIEYRYCTLMPASIASHQF